MTSNLDPIRTPAARGPAQSRFASLTFERDVAVPLPVLWRGSDRPRRAGGLGGADALGDRGVPGGRHQCGRPGSLAVQGRRRAGHTLRVRLARRAAGAAQRKLRGGLLRRRDVIGGAGDGRFLRHPGAQPAGW